MINIMICDGSCLKNPGTGGWAYAHIQDDKVTFYSGLDHYSTNNIMELTAVRNAIRHLNAILHLNVISLNTETYPNARHLNPTAPRIDAATRLKIARLDKETRENASRDLNRATPWNHPNLKHDDYYHDLISTIISVDYSPEMVSKLKIMYGNTPTIYTDSTYVASGINSWMSNWRKNGWKNSQKQIVKNVELWQEIDLIYNPLTQVLPIQVKWMRGHTDVSSGLTEEERFLIIVQDKVDQVAHKAAEACAWNAC